MSHDACEHDYWDRVRDRAAELGTDGCSWGTNLYRDCCAQHDVERRDGKTVDGDPVTANEAHARFRACMQSKAALGYWSLVPWVRWGIVRLFDRGERGRDET